MAGFSNITGDESIMFADNCSFNGTERGGKMTTNGQLWIGSTASPHVKLGNLTSTGGSVTITNGSGTINLEAGAAVPTTFQTNSGSATPALNVLRVLGSGSIQTLGAGNTVTVKLSGLTNHSLFVGSATTTFTNLGVASNGQIPIGSTGADPVLATITPGTGVSITNGAGSITINATSGGFTWTDVTVATQTLAAQNGYITDRGGGVTYTLPASGALGDIIKIVGKLGLATITPNANQQILIGSASGTVGVTGTAVSNNVGDCIELVCITAGASTVWRADSIVGTWTLN